MSELTLSIIIKCIGTVLTRL